MTTQLAYTGLLAVVALERLMELRLSHRNETRQRAAGGVEYGAGHYPAMMVLHVGLLLGNLAEVWLLDRPFIPALGYSMLALVLVAAVGRYWVIYTLGDRWTTRVIVVPGLSKIMEGPYRFMSHPNYLVVVVEGIALPLVHTNWITAVVFTIANGLLLRTRIRIEDRALQEAAAK